MIAVRLRISAGQVEAAATFDLRLKPGAAEIELEINTFFAGLSRPVPEDLRLNLFDPKNETNANSGPTLPGYLGKHAGPACKFKELDASSPATV